MVVARNLGNADNRMVEKHYGHLVREQSAPPGRWGSASRRMVYRWLARGDDLRAGL
jgi:hypothetical protein